MPRYTELLLQSNLQDAEFLYNLHRSLSAVDEMSPYKMAEIQKGRGLTPCSKGR